MRRWCVSEIACINTLHSAKTWKIIDGTETETDYCGDGFDGREAEGGVEDDEAHEGRDDEAEILALNAHGPEPQTQEGPDKKHRDGAGELGRDVLGRAKRKRFRGTH